MVQRKMKWQFPLPPCLHLACNGVCVHEEANCTGCALAARDAISGIATAAALGLACCKVQRKQPATILFTEGGGVSLQQRPHHFDWGMPGRRQMQWQAATRIFRRDRGRVGR
jgi:hypothetical protein